MTLHTVLQIIHRPPKSDTILIAEWVHSVHVNANTLSGVACFDTKLLISSLVHCRFNHRTAAVQMIVQLAKRHRSNNCSMVKAETKCCLHVYMGYESYDDNDVWKSRN